MTYLTFHYVARPVSGGYELAGFMRNADETDTFPFTMTSSVGDPYSRIADIDFQENPDRSVIAWSVNSLKAWHRKFRKLYQVKYYPQKEG